jgi:flagellar biosynthetic protein FliR
MNSLEALLRIETGTFLLEIVRIVGLVLVAPLPWSSIPARLRAALVLVLAVGIHGQAPVPANLVNALGTLALAAASDFLLGAAMGFVARLAVAVAEVAAETMTPMLGLSMLQVFDPQAQTSQSELTTLLRNLALLLALLLGLHRVLIAALLASFRAIPPGTLVSLAASTPGLIALGGATLVTGVRLALPIIAVLLMTQLALAFIARAAPAMQIFSVGFAVTLAVGFSVLIVILPDVAVGFSVELSRVGPRLERLLVGLDGTRP